MSTEGPNCKGRVTIAQIAALANVSKATVSTVLNSSPSKVTISEATRQRVIETAKRLGYRANAAARSLVTGRSHSLLLVALGTNDRHLFTRLRGAENYLQPLGYPLHVCTADAKSGLDSYLGIIHSNRADGVLLSGLLTSGEYALLEQIQKEAREVGKPVVATHNAFPPEGMGAVCHVDDAYGGELVTQHLVEHGHKRIAFIGLGDRNWSISREIAYVEAHTKAGLSVDPALIQRGSGNSNLFAWVYETVQRLAKTEEFSAMFVVTDAMAVIAIAALKAAGLRVPEDCAVVAFDDDPMCADCDPPLTTINFPFYEQGKEAARLLVDLVEGRPAESVTLPVSLVVRQSCGCRV